jgi:hypothetical protein
MAEPRGWGGPRPGAGRKPSGERPRRPVTVWLSEREAEELRGVGGGNASEGVRRLLAPTTPTAVGRDPVTGTENDRARPLHYHEYGTSGAWHEHAHASPDDAPGHVHPDTNLGPGTQTPGLP